MNVDRPASLFGLVDPCGFQVPVENLPERIRHNEQGFTPKRIRKPVEPFQLLADPIPQLRSQVRSQWHCRTLAALLVSSIQHGIRHRSVEFELCDCERCEFVSSKSGQNQRLVDQRPFDPEPFEFNHMVEIVGQPIPCPLHRSGQSVDRQRLVGPVRPLATLSGRFGSARIHGQRLPPEFGERSESSHLQQFDQFGFCHRPALSPAVALLVSLRDPCQWVRGEPFGLNAPANKSSQGLQMDVASSRRHPFDLASHQPAFDNFGSDIAKRLQSAFTQHPIPDALQVPKVSARHTVRPLMQQIPVEVIGNRGRLMIGGRSFGCADDLSSDEFGPALQLAENRPGGIFITASGGDFADEPRSVSEFGDVGA